MPVADPVCQPDPRREAFLSRFRTGAVRDARNSAYVHLVGLRIISFYAAMIASREGIVFPPQSECGREIGRYLPPVSEIQAEDPFPYGGQPYQRLGLLL